MRLNSWLAPALILVALGALAPAVDAQMLIPPNSGAFQGSIFNLGRGFSVSRGTTYATPYYGGYGNNAGYGYNTGYGYNQPYSGYGYAPSYGYTQGYNYAPRSGYVQSYNSGYYPTSYGVPYGYGGNRGYYSGTGYPSGYGGSGYGQRGVNFQTPIGNLYIPR